MADTLKECKIKRDNILDLTSRLARRVGRGGGEEEGGSIDVERQPEAPTKSDYCLTGGESMIFRLAL